jgi:hypothetical protein
MCRTPRTSSRCREIATPGAAPKEAVRWAEKSDGGGGGGGGRGGGVCVKLYHTSPSG